MKKLKISPISLLWILALIFSNSPHLTEAAIAISVHEAGHLAAARILNIDIKSITLSLVGARMECKSTPSYKKELALAAAGPCAGAVLSLFCFLINNDSPPLFYLGAISLALTVFNLIPLPSLDGGRILFCTASLLFPLPVSLKITKLCGFLSLFSLWLLSVYLLIKTASGVSMFVFCAFFFAKCFIFNSKNGDFERF